MGRRLGRVEEGLAGPDVVDVIDAEAGMLEQVRGLSVNLERILVVEEVGIESLLRHDSIVLQTITQKSQVRVPYAVIGGAAVS